MELTPRQYIIIIALIQILSFGSVLYVIKKISKNNCFDNSMNYYKYYFILAFVLTLLYITSIFLQLPQSFNIQLFLYFLIGYQLLLAVDEKYRNKVANTIFSIALFSYLAISIIFELTLFQNIIVHSIGSIVIYSLLFKSALFKAKQLNNIGFEIISVSFLFIILSALGEAFYLYQDDIKTAYLLVVTSACIGFVLVIIGFLVQILMSEYNVINTIALTDPLTGMNNRRGLYHLLESIIPSSNRNNKCCSIIAMDIDFFKKVNDTYGHDGGDIVLKEFAKMIKTTHRNTDISARLGGEEFILILPDTNKEQAYRVAEHLRSNTESLEIKMNEIIIKITSSFGIDTACDDFDIDELVKNSDKALYEAKFTGRNKIIHFEDINN